MKKIGGDSRIGLVLDVDFKPEFPWDKSVFGHALTNNGSVWNLNGRKFDGIDDYIAFPSQTLSKAVQEGWFYFTQLASVKGNLSYLYTNLYQHNANDYLYISGTGGDYFSWVPELNKWYYIVFEYTDRTDSSSSNLYVNGNKYNVNQQAGAHIIGSIGTISNSPANQAFAGSLDKVRVWDRVFSIKNYNDISRLPLKL